MLSQYMPQSFERVRAGVLPLEPRVLLTDYVKRCLRGYSKATKV